MGKLINLVVASALILNAGLSFAEESKTEPGLTPEVTEQLALANKLIALGDARKDPLLLIAAAKLQKSLTTEAANTTPQSAVTKDVLERAKKFAAGNKEMEGLVADVEAMKNKGSYDKYCNGHCTSGDARYFSGRK